MSTIPEALQSLRPGAEWVLRDDVIEWLDAYQTQPTDVEIAAERERLDQAAIDEIVRVGAINDDTGLQDLVARLKSATPAQWASYLQANLVDLASARTIIYRMGLVLMLLARKRM